MKMDILSWIAGRPVVAYGAGEYFDRAQCEGHLKIDYFIDDALADTEKCGRPVYPFKQIQQEKRDVAVIIFSRQIGEALLRLRQAGLVWQEQVTDCRCFGVMNRYADDYHYFETLEELCASKHVEVSTGIEAKIQMERLLLPVRQNGDKIRIRVGNQGQLDFTDGVMESGIELNVGADGKMKIGSGSHISEGSILSAATRSRIELGGRNLISHSSVVDAANDVSIQTGDQCTFGWHLHLYAYAPIVLGNDVMASSYVYIESGAGHDLVIAGEKRYPEPLHIGEHVWLGLNSTILAGSQIGDGCMIGASSLVNRQFGHKQLIAGNPARVIKEQIDWDRNYAAYKELYQNQQGSV